MVKFENACIYKISCKDPLITDCYIGATTNFKSRISRHKRNCVLEGGRLYNTKVYTFIREHGGFDNWDMKIVNKLSCENFTELRKKERLAVDLFDASLNMIRPYITKAEKNASSLEYYHKHAEEIKIKRKDYFLEYNEKRKGKRLEYNKEYSKRPEVIARRKAYYEKGKLLRKEAKLKKQLNSTAIQTI